MSQFKHPTRDDLQLERVLGALGDPVRLMFIMQLASCPKGSPMNCAKVAEKLASIPLSTRHHHMRILREAGVIESKRQGVHILNTLRKDDLDARFPGLLATVLGLVKMP